MRYQASHLAALVQNRRKAHSIIKVKLLKKHPHLRGTDFTNYLHKIRTIASDNHGLQNIHKPLLLPVSYSSCVNYITLLLETETCTDVVTHTELPGCYQEV